MLAQLPKALALVMHIYSTSAYEDSQRLSMLMIARICRPKLLNVRETGGLFPQQLLKQQGLVPPRIEPRIT